MAYTLVLVRLFFEYKSKNSDSPNFPVAVIPENDSKSLNKFWKVIVAITLLSVETSVPFLRFDSW